MTKKCHRSQTNPLHNEEETQSRNTHTTSRTKSKAIMPEIIKLFEIPSECHTVWTQGPRCLQMLSAGDKICTCQVNS